MYSESLELDQNHFIFLGFFSTFYFQTCHSLGQNCPSNNASLHESRTQHHIFLSLFIHIL